MVAPLMVNLKFLLYIKKVYIEHFSILLTGIYWCFKRTSQQSRHRIRYVSSNCSSPVAKNGWCASSSTSPTATSSATATHVARQPSEIPRHVRSCQNCSDRQMEMATTKGRWRSSSCTPTNFSWIQASKEKRRFTGGRRYGIWSFIFDRRGKIKCYRIYAKLWEAVGLENTRCKVMFELFK